MTIRAYHEHRGDSHRNVALIPSLLMEPTQPVPLWLVWKLLW